MFHSQHPNTMTQTSSDDLSGGDEIDKLPVVKNPPSPFEMRLARDIFQSDRVYKGVFGNFPRSELILIGVLYAIFSIPVIDKFLLSIVHDNIMYKYSLILAIKTVIFIVLTHFIITVNNNER